METYVGNHIKEDKVPKLDFLTFFNFWNRTWKIQLAWLSQKYFNICPWIKEDIMC